MNKTIIGKTHKITIITIYLIFMIAIITISCNNEPIDVTLSEAIPTGLYKYQGTTVNLNGMEVNALRGFTLDSDGVLYIVSLLESPSNQITSQINAYDFDGNEIASYIINGFGEISHICVDKDNGLLYYISDTISEMGFVPALFELNLAKEESKLLYVLSMLDYESNTDIDFFQNTGYIQNIMYLKGNIYILGRHKDYTDIQPEFWDGNPREQFFYNYDGTVLMAYNLSDNSMEIVYDDFPHSFTITPDEMLMVYAHDASGGYYFVDVDPEALSRSEKKYMNIQRVSTFATDGIGIWYNQGASIEYTSLKEDTGFTKIALDVRINLGGYGPILHWNGYTFYIGSDATEIAAAIHRVKNSDFITDNQPIKWLSRIDYAQPGVLAFNIKPIVMSDYEFSLTVLSLDSQYDIYYMHSYDNFAYNIRNKGAFYPLNEVPGVIDYLDACFPHIKEAATDDNGNIWMLPLSVNVEGILYNKNNCNKIGINFEDNITADLMLENIIKASEYDIDGIHYRLDVGLFAKKQISEYLRNNKTLDTPQFKQITESIKQLYNQNPAGEIKGTTYDILITDLISTDLNLLFYQSHIFPFGYHVTGREDIYIAPLTTDKTSQNCYFICVNPMADNLEYTLRYVSEISKHLSANKNSYDNTFSNIMIYEDYNTSNYVKRYYSFLQDGYIDFGIPDEIIYNDFISYLRNEITLDDMIAEAQRKLSMYLSE